MSPAKNSSAQTLLQSITAATRKTAQWTAHLLVFALTFSYHGRLGLATLRPIRQVVKSHNDPDQLKVSLGYFKARKIRELEFVRPASALSAGANIGVFQWADVSDAFWVAKVFWYWGLCFAFFSLVSSTCSELLDLIPAASDTHTDADDRLAVLPLLTSIRKATSTGSSLSAVEEPRPNWLMAYVWQCPVMLMSWSWVSFFAGFILFISTPIIPVDQSDHEVKLIIAVLTVSGLAILNFFFCSALTQIVSAKVRNQRKNAGKSELWYFDSDSIRNLPTAYP